MHQDSHNEGNGPKSLKGKGLDIYNNNISFPHTHSHTPVPARTRKSPEDKLLDSPPLQPACWDCRFYTPESGHDVTGPWPDECEPGECHRYPPRVGGLVKDRHGDDWRCYADFPKVMACDWCGEYQPRRGIDQSTKGTGAEETCDPTGEETIIARRGR